MSLIDVEVWLNHFEHHARHARCVPEGLADRLTPRERRIIAGSIATFQLGEQSEGRTLLGAADRFAQRQGIPLLVRIVELLIREEQRHAVLLKSFMEDHQIALKTTDWSDWVFRRIRRLAGLELYLHVLISAELIGIVYYRSLEAATECERLRVLCRVLVADELAHVGFESQLLLALRARRTTLVQSVIRSAHRAMLVGTAGVVWFAHRPVLRAGGLDLRSFLRACLAQYAFYLEPVRVGSCRHGAVQWRPRSARTLKAALCGERMPVGDF